MRVARTSPMQVELRFSEEEIALFGQRGVRVTGGDAESLGYEWRWLTGVAGLRQHGLYEEADKAEQMLSRFLEPVLSNHA